MTEKAQVGTKAQKQASNERAHGAIRGRGAASVSKHELGNGVAGRCPLPALQSGGRFPVARALLDPGWRERRDRRRSRKRCPAKAPVRGRDSFASALLAGLLLVLCAGLLVPATAVAQTVLVSNTGQELSGLFHRVGTSGSNQYTQAQGFTTGSNSGGYALGSVQVYINNFTGTDAARVSIYSDSSGSPGSSLAVLDNPNSITNNSLNTFTAPANLPTLAAGTSYFVVVEATSNSFAMGRTITNNEDAGGASGWTINDSRHFRTSDSGSWSTGNEELRIAVYGPAMASTNAAPTAANGTVTTNEDTAYTFAASDFGYSDSDSDPLASVKVTTLPAAGTGTLALSGTAVTLNQEVTKAQIDANNLTYTPPANANGTGYASFGFKVNDGTDESAAAYTMTINVTAVNDAATGFPAITGTAQVDQTLTATLGTIADVDGRAATFPDDYSFQWRRRAPGSTGSVAIPGATSSTYTVVAGDVDHTISVRVSFTDGAGNNETRASGMTAAVVAAANAAPTAANGTVTTTEDTAYTFAASDFGYSDSDSDPLASVKVTTLPAAGTGTLALSGTAVTLNQEVTKAQIDANSLTYTPPANANGTGYASFGFKVNDGTDESAAAYTMTINVIAVNDAATGAPTITGTATVGQTLTANLGTIADVDRLPSTTFPTGYNFQWIQVDGGTETDISGATMRTYALAPADAGKTVKVRVSFTDSAGNAEARTSAAHPPSGTTCNIPALPGRTVIATTTVTVGSLTIEDIPPTTYYGFRNAAFGSLSGDSSFTLGLTSYTIEGMRVNDGGVSDGRFYFSVGRKFGLSDERRLQVHVCDETFSLVQAGYSGDSYFFGDTDSGLDWSSETSRTVRVSVSPPEAKSAALVTNFNQGQDSSNDTSNPRAMRFSTGSSNGGYWLSSIGIISEDEEEDSFSATLCPTDDDGFPRVPPTEVPAQSSCVALTPPASFAAGTLTFAAPSNTRLAPSTTYTLVLLKGSGVSRVKYDATGSSAEDSSSASGWTIGNRYEFYHSSGEWRMSSSQRTLRIAVRGRTAPSRSPSSDATLSALALSDGTLSPAFSSPVEDYMASVGIPVSRITVTPTTNVTSIVDFAGTAISGPTVAYLDGDDRPLADADANTDGFQVNLSVGDNPIKVRVTAEDGTTMKTYTVIVNLPVDPAVGLAATVAEPFTYTVPANAFSDTRVGDTFSAVLNGPGALDRPLSLNLVQPNRHARRYRPSWLFFDASTRTFFGSPLPGSDGKWSITVRKKRPGETGSATITFGLTVRIGDAGLVSNFASPGTAGRNMEWINLGQKFTTGGASNGYAVTSVDLSLSGVGSTGNFPTVSIRSGSANEPNGSTIATLTPPSRAESRHKIYRYTVPAGTTLDPNETYWLVVAGGSARVYTTGWTTLDAGSAAGWAIDRATYRRWTAFGSNSPSSWEQTPTGSSTGSFMSLRINGAAASSQQAVDPPTIAGTPVLSGAGEDGRWSESETVRVALTFSEAVDVDTSEGTPTVEIDLGAGGSALRDADYESGSGTATLTFAYTLVAADGEHSSMAVTPDSLALDSGTIRSSETGFDALLGHQGTLVQGAGGGGSRNSPEVGFHDVPESHDGETPFTLTVAFGGAPDGLSPKRDAGSTFEVEGGAVTKSRQAPKQSAGTWELTVTPSGSNAVTVRVPAKTCGEAHAVCIGGRALPEAAEVTIAGSRMTAQVTAASASHDGSAAFEIDFEFSHAPQGLSYRTVHNDLFDVTGGLIVRAKRLTRGENLGWRLTVQPDGDGAVTVDARATNDCEASHAVCDAEGRMFDGELEHTVPGPAPVTPTVVSIAAGETLVNEGTDLPFTLSRTGPTDAALAVNVTVSENGDVLASSPPTSVTFAAGAATATLNVATVDDETEEDTSRVTATLAAGSGYTVDADASTAEGYVESEDLAPITAWFTEVVDEHRGSGTFSLRFAFSHEMPEYSYRTVHKHLFDVTGGTIKRARRLVRGSSLGWEITVAPQGFDPVTLAARATTDCDVAHAACDPWGRKFDGNLSTTIVGPPTLSVADATVEEAEGAVLDFVVTLSRALSETVTVGYATADGTAAAGSDYTGTSGTLTFAANETAKTVSVPVLDDAHDEGSETVGFTLSNPSPARVKLADASAQGSITNDDRMPQAWIARFGRTVAEQAMDAVQSRFAAPRAAGLSGSIAGLGLGGLTGEADAEEAVEADVEDGVTALSNWLAGEDEGEPETRTLTGHDLLTGSSFAMTAGSAEAGFASFWGRGAVTRFDGREGEMTLDGEVSSAMLGTDFSRDALVAGLMLSHARGEGGYRSPAGDGEVESTLTTLFPYGRIEASERLSLWAMAGYGEGTLTLTPDGEPALRPDLSFLMGAVGARSVLAGREGQAMLALKSDAMAARTSTDAVTDPEGGNLAASEADVTRLRLALEGSRPVALGESTVLTPSLEVGLRHDAGDAETGFGADIGVGLALSDAARGITSEIRARGLLTHEAEGFGERGLSGTLSFDPRPSDDRGLALSLTQTMGGPATGGADALLGRTTLAGLGSDDDDGLDARQLDARVEYGFGVFEDRYTAIPELGLGLSESAREMRLGWRLAERRSAGLAFELGVEGTRRERTDATGAEHGLSVGAGWKLISKGTESLELRLEAARRDAAGDDADAEHNIGVRLGARW